MNKPWSQGVLCTKGRYFYHGDVPFFWLGDTAWRLFQCLNEEQTHRYLKNRKDKGYNVIQAVLLASVKFMEGYEPCKIIHDDTMEDFISEKNEAYWQHVEMVVQMAADMGIYLALLPTWGDFAKINYLNNDNAPEYMAFLNKRFDKYPNIIWLLGGDIRGDVNYEMYNAAGAYLKTQSTNKLVGFHPFGRTSSSYWFNECAWLDFNQFQSGHRRYDQRDMKAWDDKTNSEPWHGEDSFKYVENDLAKTPLRPVLDGEPSYELIPQGLHDGTQPFWQAHHVRRYAWWPVLAGGAGHTYGDNAIMQMFGFGTKPAYSVEDTWDVALHHEGSGQMQFLMDLMLEMDYTQCEPVQSLLGNDVGEKEETIRIFGSNQVLAAYNYSGRNFTMHVPMDADAWWFDPASGVRSYFGQIKQNTDHNFTPPRKRFGHNDWVLLLKRADIGIKI